MFVTSLLKRKTKSKKHEVTETAERSIYFVKFVFIIVIVDSFAKPELD